MCDYTSKCLMKVLKPSGPFFIVRVRTVPCGPFFDHTLGSGLAIHRMSWPFLLPMCFTFNCTNVLFRTFANYRGLAIYWSIIEALQCIGLVLLLTSRKGRHKRTLCKDYITLHFARLCGSIAL